MFERNCAKREVGSMQPGTALHLQSSTDPSIESESTCPRRTFYVLRICCREGYPSSRDFEFIERFPEQFRTNLPLAKMSRRQQSFEISEIAIEKVGFPCKTLERLNGY